MANARFRGSRKTKAWIGMSGGNIPMTANGTFLGGAIDVSINPDTVIRMIGGYVIWPTTSPTAGDVAQVAVGIGVVSTDAKDVGGSALPDPGTEAQYPWLYYREHSLRFGTTSLDPNGLGFVRESFDIGSMRILKPRESLVFVVEYTDINGIPALTLTQDTIRVLIAHA